MILPIIHRNGTAAAALLDQTCNVTRCLRESKTALAEASPNGRDYYLVPGLIEKAEAQHRQRMGVLDALIVEFERQAEALAEKM